MTFGIQRGKLELCNGAVIILFYSNVAYYEHPVITTATTLTTVFRYPPFANSRLIRDQNYREQSSLICNKTQIGVVKHVT